MREVADRRMRQGKRKRGGSYRIHWNGRAVTGTIISPGTQASLIAVVVRLGVIERASPRKLARGGGRSGIGGRRGNGWRRRGKKRGQKSLGGGEGSMSLCDHASLSCNVCLEGVDVL